MDIEGKLNLLYIDRIEYTKRFVESAAVLIGGMSMVDYDEETLIEESKNIAKNF
nr:hypothetical protein [Clostridium sporogenes]